MADRVERVVIICLLLCLIFVSYVVVSAVSSLQADFMVLQGDTVDSINDLRVSVERVGVLSFGNGMYNNFSGLYVPRADAYVVTTRRDPLSVINTGFHEYAHYLQNEMFARSDVDVWVGIHNSSNLTVSDYALTSYKEDFADTFEYVSCLRFSSDRLSELSVDRREYFVGVVVPELERSGVLC